MADWELRHSQRFDSVVAVPVEHPLGRFLAACAEGGYPGVVPCMYARADVATVEWPADRLIPYRVFAMARALCDVDVHPQAWQWMGELPAPTGSPLSGWDVDLTAIPSAIFRDPWPAAGTVGMMS